MNISIKALSPSLIEDYLYFFDQMVFTENPHWSQCYCYSYHFTGASEEWNKEKNRLAVIDLIQAGKMKGFLAFEDDMVVGWCNANDKCNYQSLTKGGNKKSELCSIVCFLIHPRYRRSGIAQKLLERVIESYGKEAFRFIEAYPRKETHSCERNYHGHFSMYKKLNFRIEEELDDHYVVRKRLGK